MHWDLIHLKKGIRNMKYINYLYYPYSKYHLGKSLKSKDQASKLLTLILNLIKINLKLILKDSILTKTKISTISIKSVDLTGLLLIKAL
jgi:hypothetical protein